MNHRSASAMAARARKVRKFGTGSRPWLSSRTVKSAHNTRITNTIGMGSVLTTVIQCGWSFKTRSSPGRSLLMAGYSPLFSLDSGSRQLEERQQCSGRQVWAVGDRAFQRAVRDDERDRADGREQHA